MRRHELIGRMRPLLLKRREALLRALDDEFTVTLSIDDGDVRDIADKAVETEYREVYAELADIESRELKRIGEALARIEHGSNGVCESCDRNIPMIRLQALPYATKCVRCQQAEDAAAGDQTNRIQAMTGTVSLTCSMDDAALTNVPMIASVV